MLISLERSSGVINSVLDDQSFLRDTRTPQTERTAPPPVLNRAIQWKAEEFIFSSPVESKSIGGLGGVCASRVRASFSTSQHAGLSTSAVQDSKHTPESAYCRTVTGPETALRTLTGDQQRTKAYHYSTGIQRELRRRVDRPGSAELFTIPSRVLASSTDIATTFSLASSIVCSRTAIERKESSMSPADSDGTPIYQSHQRPEVCKA
ncbi:uncharacterized protein L969DRAFT_100950 [Mixia osmundae IAM 14324]|uniref:Uncharacterized protein n=1 Tax=Mixia osmundae (strain CBS 9802 / IAM 14324 / JCM 22182 / KY 12970) TaxID=764103 RepID=G7E352_MIXOS|nr:uncharacterized protein L969DRAFT_100950 [Mixia osmundae IAM 14324]KEI42482.1 hypothetical protein L969DRAFT_100950 [Mixia osmundae IAM 14324]GAA97233.1 hypothetical protein E5Q_03909 [Mixia osmundae IAM 14324]